MGAIDIAMPIREEEGSTFRDIRDRDLERRDASVFVRGFRVAIYDRYGLLERRAQESLVWSGVARLVEEAEVALRHDGRRQIRLVSKSLERDRALGGSYGAGVRVRPSQRR